MSTADKQLPTVERGGPKCVGGCTRDRVESLAFCSEECRDRYFVTEHEVNPILAAFRQRFVKNADINEFTPFGFFEAGYLAAVGEPQP